jgi:hypothetical protein
MFKYAMPKTQTLNCRRFKAVDSTSLLTNFNRQGGPKQQTAGDSSNKAVDSKNQKACLPTITSVEPTKHSWNVLHQSGRFLIK